MFATLVSWITSTEELSASGLSSSEIAATVWKQLASLTRSVPAASEPAGSVIDSVRGVVTVKLPALPSSRSWPVALTARRLSFASRQSFAIRASFSEAGFFACAEVSSTVPFGTLRSPSGIEPMPVTRPRF